LLPLFLLTHCGTAQVLNTSQHEAAELLKNGNIDFILEANLPADFSRAVNELHQLSRIHPAAAYYSALLVGNSSLPEQRKRELERLLFSAALDSPSITARREAALKLIPIIMRAEETRVASSMLSVLDSRNLRRRSELHLTALRAASFYRLGRYAEVAGLFPGELTSENSVTANNPQGWAKAIMLLAAWKVSPSEVLLREIPDFLFTIPPGEILRWAHREALSLEGLFEQEELMVLSARLISGNFRAMLINLRPGLQDGGTIFFRYPSLLSYLGRAFQFTPEMRQEGLRLFESWIGLLDAGEPLASDESGELLAFINTLSSETIRDAKYMLLFFSGRIERAMGNHNASSAFFWRALEYSPNAIQSDATIWYILMNTLVSNPSAAPSQVIDTMHKWGDFSTFSAVLDRVSSNLARQRQWGDILEIFLRIESTIEGRAPPGSSAALAQYAWITGRAIQEGFITTQRSAESFFLTAFEAESASFYYRAMAASKLGLNVTLERENTTHGRAARSVTIGDEAEFLLGFFECGAASFFMPYLRAMEGTLPFPELRLMAEALASEGQWLESLRLVARYTRRSDYVFNIQDLYIAHPRPFLELIEKYSREMDIGPELFFGLVRTESHFMNAIASHAGAVGLAQFMPSTAEDMATRIARRGGPDYRSPYGIDLTDPEINIHLGTFYLRTLIDNFGNPMLALKAYNGGQGRVRRWQATDRQLGALPLDLFLETIEFHETREYGRRVLSAAAIYGYLYYGMNMEEVAASIFR